MVKSTVRRTISKGRVTVASKRAKASSGRRGPIQRIRVARRTTVGQCLCALSLDRRPAGAAGECARRGARRAGRCDLPLITPGRLAMTTATLNDDMLDFLTAQLRAIRPSLPANLLPDVHYTVDLNIDSLDLVELVARIEQRYGLKVPDADLAKFISLDATLQYIVTHAGQ